MLRHGVIRIGVKLTFFSIKEIVLYLDVIFGFGCNN
jgi:hypothetical protein